MQTCPVTEDALLRKLSGVVSPDPLKGLPIGANLRIRPVVFGTSDAQCVPLHVTNWTFFEGALLAVAFHGGQETRIDGTAVMIAPGLAMTATHVLANNLEGLRDGTVFGICAGPRSGGLDLWKFRSISHDEADDTAFLSLELMSPITDGWHLSTMPLTTRCPSVGEKVTITGFRFEEPWGFASDGSPVEAIGNLYAASGEVSAVYHPFRDHILMPYPAIEIQCGSLGAMSGGAVLDRDGCLLGLIARGFNTEAKDGPTYASWIVSSALARKLDIPWPPGMYAGQVSATAIADAALRIIGREALTVEGSTVQYTVWF